MKIKLVPPLWREAIHVGLISMAAAYLLLKRLEDWFDDHTKR